MIERSNKSEIPITPLHFFVATCEAPANYRRSRRWNFESVLPRIINLTGRILFFVVGENSCHGKRGSTEY